jgi:site-specific recombinase XerD
LNSSAIPKIKQELKLEQKFHKYMINKNMSINTANSYKSSINSISKDYSKKTNQNIDIYQILEQGTINEIAQKYSQEGKYAIAGNNGRATWRNAIAKYSKFFASRGNINN